MTSLNLVPKISGVESCDGSTGNEMTSSLTPCRQQYPVNKQRFSSLVVYYLFVAATVGLLLSMTTKTSATATPSAVHSRQRRTVEFIDSRQRDFVDSLRDFEISIPIKVTSSGEHLSHSVVHSVTSLNGGSNNRRRRRSAQLIDDEDRVHYHVNVNGTVLHLELQTNHKLFAPGLIIERRNAAYRNLSESSILRNMADSDRCHFHGKIRDKPDSAVALSACYGLHGFIHTGNEEYFIEPVRGHQVDPRQGSAVGHPHLVYRRSALPSGLHILNNPSTDQQESQERHGTCGVTGDSSNVERTDAGPKSSTQTRRKKRSISLERNVETLIVVDQSMVEYYKNEDIENYVLTIMNMVSTMYHDATIGNAINIVLVRIIFLEQEEVGLKIGHHADNTLASFCKWQISINPKDEIHPNHHDVAVLLTRINICSRSNEPCSTLGLSQVSGMCQPHRSCNINEDTGLALAFTVAHEIGHNFGMQHDTIENGCEAKLGESQHVMSPQMSAEASPLIWSNCSRKAVTVFLDRDWGYCLNDEPAEHKFNFPVLPPGVMYDIDHQCRLQYGPEAEFCDGIDDPCTTVWCRVEKKCLTRLEAAAAGTLCRTDESGAQQHWCFGGQCTEILEKPLAIDGQWSEWAPWSECSRSCGAGVSHSERHCTNPPPSHGGRYCLGERKRFRICKADTPCPEGAPSFKEHQCAEFNSIPYKGQRYEYEPVNTPATPCQLHCRPKGRLFSVMLKDVVTDGTPCRRGRRDMCISGRCRVIGCDWNIESDAVEDQCGVCHGDGTTCTTIKQSFDKLSGLGYVEATVIPEGARNIRVEEVAEANNYLAIRNEKGQYYLNGHWYIQWSGDYEVAGTVIRYRREGNKESLDAPGPIKEPLHVMLLFQSQNPGVKLEYTVPIENVTEKRRPEFHWKYVDWTHCTASCGGGTQNSRVVCVEKEAGTVDDMYCNASTKPDDMHMSCNEHQCPARWWTGPWQHCSVTCGSRGTRKRTVLCVRQLGPDEQIALEDRECEDLARPDDVSQCRHKEPCPVEQAQWKTGPWNNEICQTEPCGMQTRPVLCTDPLGKCDPTSMPEIERRCSNATCGTWRVGNWSMCSKSCGVGHQFRDVICASGRTCPMDEKPIGDQECNLFPCTTTTSAPVTMTSETATTPVTSRTVTTRAPVNSGAVDLDIGFVNPPSGQSDSSDLKVARTSNSFQTTTMNSVQSSRSRLPIDSGSTSLPSQSAKNGSPVTTEAIQDPSTTSKSPTHYRWMALFWDECSRKCGGGTKHRRVRCIDMKSKETVADELCASQQKPPEDDTCNTNSCLEWTTSPWQQCSTTCSEGLQQRDVTCPQPGLCDPDYMPTDKRLCDAGPCLQWTAGPWDKCSQTCGGGVQRREVRCINAVTQQNASGCNPLEQLSAIENCNTAECSSDGASGQSESAAASAGGPAEQCVDTMSAEMCRALLRMGRCRLEYIQRKCCRTCVGTRNREESGRANHVS